ncbi:MAG: response regulator transcription factor [Bdellovibrionales bacterium]|nr:response regulator transcription factor [Bdellovibrionales bacterium]
MTLASESNSQDFSSGNELQRTYSVVITDDHKIIRCALTSLLNKRSEFKVVGEARSVEETLEIVTEKRPDFLILDIGLPNQSGFEALYEIKKRSLPTKVFIFTMYEDEEMVTQSLEGGAIGFLSKMADPADLIDGLKQAMNGECYLPDCYSHLAPEKKVGSERCIDLTDPLGILSDRERQVFYMLADGLPNRSIAKKLFISPRTVETHRARVIKKLNVDSTVGLVRYAIKNNLVML